MADLSQHYGSTLVARVEFQRPNDVLPYVAGDAVATAVTDSATTPLLKLQNIVRESGGSGYIVGIRLWTDQVACVATWRVHFYKLSQPTAAVPGDNVPMTLLYANFADRVGAIDLTAMKSSTVTGTSTAAGAGDSTLRHFFSLAGLDVKDLCIRLETTSAFTPAANQKFYLEVATECN